ncbi:MULTISPECIES: apolipoprotein N-acyltransferase [unclassified Kitasatospora]|uniref:apolipoprotein N-acyltransferase n=1 Tax=unclassified Kitasatospora TaxID=2633591 RepID=UPI00070D862D|nr:MULTISPECIES: apolipoprotein N-acyltransferase [unclassified Kitasatospora]KQV09857.1 acyltransferase [Kitasatospora sp. Root107]KRB70097.1 acyltransferase [Kitasatospora sp. Root187]
MALPVEQEHPVTAPDPEPVAPRAGRPARLVAGLPRTGLAVLCGLLLALAFPPYNCWPLSLVGVAGLSLLTRGRTARQGAWTGFAFGLPFFLLLLWWLRVIGTDATIGLSVIEALFLAALGAGLAATSRLPGWPLWAACLWVTQEWARDRLPLGGFPWGRLAFANTATPFTPLAALGGAPLVTFAVALCGTLLAWAALRLRRGPRRSLPAAALAGAGAVAVLLAGYLVPVPTAAAETVKVAVIQGNVPNPGMHFLGTPMTVLKNHARETELLAAEVAAGRAERPDVVIWPENSSDFDPFTSPEAYERIDAAVKAIGVPVLVGALVNGPDEQHVLNQGIVWDPKTGPGASYTKQHPVPFGEYVPFRDQLSKVITRLQQVARDFFPGTSSGVLQLGPARIGDVICFEVAYDEIVRDTVNQGGRVLVVQTNNATYANSGQPDQQLAMSRLRAVEHGRAVLIAATSGISAIVAPDGRVTDRTEELTADQLSAVVALRDGRTLADRVGAAPEWVLAMGGLLACGLVVLDGFRRRRSAGTRAES